MPAEWDHIVVMKADGNNNVRLAVPAEAFDAADVKPSEHREVVEPSSRPGHFEVTVGAAGSRYLADMARLPAKAKEWPEQVEGIAAVVAEAVPFTTDRVRGERENGQNRRVAIYSGDLARGQGDSVEEVSRKFGGSSAPSTANRDRSPAGRSKAEILADHPMADRILDVTARFIALVVPDPVTTAGECWGVTAPGQKSKATIRVNCGRQHVFWGRFLSADEPTWSFCVASGEGRAAAQQLARELPAELLDYDYTGPPVNVALRVGDSEIDSVLALDSVLTTTRHVTQSLCGRRLPQANFHDPAVYELLLPTLGAG
ncbi:MAG: hypothetical protein JNK12_05435 [Acidimicrobiales bacterium]|nr:hypothetical protein [Acidimicrobiales bacterium]